jgi:hypothetical protein
LIPCAHSPSED